MTRRRSRRTDTRLIFGAVALASGLLLYLALRPALGWPGYAVWLVSASLVTLALYTFDKLQSKQQGRALRVPEVVLKGAALIGGFAGGWIGMLLLRHKTRHQDFWAVLVVSTVRHAVVAYFIVQ